MSLEFYKIMHIVGLAAIIAALGGAAVHAINGGTRDTNKARGLVAATHGIGLVLMLVGGFGMLAKLGIMAAMPGWVYAKLALWLVVGALIVIPLRKPELAKPLWLLVPVVAGLGAWMGLLKPF
jgi:hypothetical protein